MENDALNLSLAAKQQRRHALAKLPIEEKLRAVIQLQAMAAPILESRGTPRCLWSFPPACERLSKRMRQG